MARRTSANVTSSSSLASLARRRSSAAAISASESRPSSSSSSSASTDDARLSGSRMSSAWATANTRPPALSCERKAASSLRSTRWLRLVSNCCSIRRRSPGPRTTPLPSSPAAICSSASSRSQSTALDLASPRALRSTSSSTASASACCACPPIVISNPATNGPRAVNTTTRSPLGGAAAAGSSSWDVVSVAAAPALFSPGSDITGPPASSDLVASGEPSASGAAETAARCDSPSSMAGVGGDCRPPHPLTKSAPKAAAATAAANRPRN